MRTRMIMSASSARPNWIPRTKKENTSMSYATVNLQLMRRVSGVMLVGMLMVGCSTGNGKPLGEQKRMSERADAANLLTNGSFEVAENPQGWRGHKWGGGAVEACAASGRTGGRGVMIKSERGGDFSWIAGVEVKPYSTYRLSGWIKTDDVKVQGGKGALITASGIESAQTPA